MTWTIHPLLDEPRAKSAALILILVGLGSAFGVSFGGVAYGVGTVGVLGAAMSRYLFATTYTLDDSGLTTSHLMRTRHRCWRDFRRADIRPHGIFLSPSERPSRLDSFRGLFLPGTDDSAEIAAIVSRHVH